MLRIGRRVLNGHDVADLIVLVGLAAVVIWYLQDSYRASSHLLNLILVLPVSVIVLVLCLIEFSRQMIGRDARSETSQLESAAKVVPIITLFFAYVLTLKWLGFDLGTALFVSSSLWMHGERRIRWILGYSICFALVVSLLFSRMLPYPMPLMFLPAAQ